MDKVIHILENAEFWKSVAFVFIVLVTIFPAYRFLVVFSRRQSDKIIHQLNEALALKREAESLLKENQKKNYYRDTERKELLKKALRDARLLKSDAQKNLDCRLEAKKAEILERVRLIKESGLKSLREKVVSMAVDTTEEIIYEDKKLKENKVFFDTSLQELEGVLSKKEEVEKIINAV